MASWSEFEAEAPELAARVKARFTATEHHVLATLRKDGSPRVSGSEIEFEGDDIYIGSMAGGRKGQDLRRDPRFAFHSNPGDPSMEGGDAKISGLAEPLGAHPVHSGGERFRLSIREVVLTSLHPKGDRLVIETWRPGHPAVKRDRF